MTSTTALRDDRTLSQSRHRAEPARSWAARLVRGPESDPDWARPGLLALLAATAVLYLWGLGASGWANDFYAAAVQAGTKSWKALLFGSLDAGNAITVDKPPAALWVMGVSGRIFGFNSWSLLAPQALMGVASVGLLYGAVRRLGGAGAGLLAGAALASTPVAALMFRFDNPDALLVLLLVAAAYAVVRAIESGRTAWLVAAGAALGFGFLTKLLQAFLIAPALALVFLLAAPGRPRRRLAQLLAAGVALVVSGGWFVALVSLWPASSRPYIGGSTDNSLLQLALGYNGLGRVLGGEGNGGGPGGPGGGNTAFGGSTGITRLFGPSMGAEIAWLLPAALLGLIAGLWLTRRAPRTDRTRAALLLWGGWLLVTGVVFSYMQGTVHPYYTVALAPAVAALAALGVRELWSRRSHPAARATLAAMAAGTGAWNFALLDRTAEWQPWLRWTLDAGRGRRAGRGGDAGRRASAAPGRGGVGRRGHRVRHGRLRRVRRRHRGAPAHRFHSDLGPGDLRHGGRSAREPAARDRADGHAPRRQRLRGGRVDQCHECPLGRGDGRLAGRRRAGADHRQVGAGDRRIHRLGRLADARAVRAVRRRRPGALLHHRRSGRSRRDGRAGPGVRRRGGADHRVGRVPLSPDDGGRQRGLRPRPMIRGLVTCHRSTGE
jgi:4-amino-4-deoxy-L-arabinose transferase-like glycosyltransferase